MTKHKGHVVEAITDTGTTENGEHVKLSLRVKGIPDPVNLFFPAVLMQRLVTAAISGAGVAHQEQIKKFGTSQTIADAFGVAPFFPSEFELGRFHNMGEKREYVLLRLKKENVPLIDVAIDPKSATAVGEGLIAEVKKGPTTPKTQQ